MTGHDKPPTPDCIAAVKGEDIDFSGIPELDEAFWREAELVVSHPTEQITIRVKRSVLHSFGARGEKLRMRFDRVLKSHFRARRETK